MKVWTIANQKGGVGKTTTVVTIAGVLAKMRHRVLVIDTDPHASLGHHFGIDSDAQTATLFDLFQTPKNLNRSKVLHSVYPTSVENISLMPASIGLATIDRRSGQQDGMGLVLANTVKALQDDFDYILIDCPPVLGVLMVNALAACDQVLIPVQTEFLALKGLDRMVNTLTMMGRSQGRQYAYTIIPTMFDQRTKAAKRALAQLQCDFPAKLHTSVIPVDTQFREASLKRLPLTHCAPNSRGVDAYRQLTKAVMAKEAVHG
ncbi:ParA family protein [Paraferrimonas sedimenticola]|uniref:Cobyric acid synthase n=1 Tax=Paraferrimonas sedimenticola TaxID=375674 RepID=A0AA37RU23_9GAMM|nr:ParA family protein [Paraferrimonas sedimenticola]GLP94952.1 cobyric acid synthase [Paraferrimonas sedimenticola]